MSRKRKRSDRPYPPYVFPQPARPAPAPPETVDAGHDQMDLGLGAAARAAGESGAPPDTASSLVYGLAEHGLAEHGLAEPGAPSADAPTPAPGVEADAAADESAAPVEHGLFVTPADTQQALGARLRAAREARGYTLDEVARLSRVPGALLADIEAGRTERLGAPIYLRGYLRAFARAVGVPEIVVRSAVDMQSPPALVATHTPSRSRYLANRYMPLVAYALLTVMVLVPIVMIARLGTAPVLHQAGVATDLQELDMVTGQATPSITLPEPRSGQGIAGDVAPPPTEPASATTVESVATGAREPAPERPLLASLATMPSSAVEPATVGQSVRLTLAQDSWVEFTGADGRRIEYALLPAGTDREYRVAGHAELRIGNTRGARLEIDGRPVDLAPHTRANVARMSVGSDVGGG